jgi:quinol monooxygenase YgiN
LYQWQTAQRSPDISSSIVSQLLRVTLHYNTIHNELDSEVIVLIQITARGGHRMDSSSSSRLAQVKKTTSSSFLREAKLLVEAEPGTVAWFAFRLGPSSFWIFDAFNSEDDRQAHFHGKVREAIIARADELFRTPPVITPVDVLASKLPGA